MDDREVNNIYAIPANYTDSGKLFGGMLEVRNTVEAVFLVVLLGYPELMWLPITGTMKIVVMTITLLPLGVVALMGIAGDSLLQYCGHITRHSLRRRQLHYRRIGYRYEYTNAKVPKKRKREKRTQKSRAKG